MVNFRHVSFLPSGHFMPYVASGCAIKSRQSYAAQTRQYKFFLLQEQPGTDPFFRDFFNPKGVEIIFAEKVEDGLDHAQISNEALSPGGIDMNPAGLKMQLKGIAGAGLDNAMASAAVMKHWQEINIEGLSPLILGIRPLKDSNLRRLFFNTQP